MLAAALAAGCKGTPIGSDGSNGPNTLAASKPPVKVGLIPQSRPPVEDLPVPIGFKLVESISRNFESAGSRYVDHTYEGKADKVEVERFYRQQMPLKGWTLLGSQMIRGVYRLRYEKGNEGCDVEIESEGRPIVGPISRIRFNVQTLGRGETPSYNR